MRRVIGQLTHLAYGTRPDVAAWVGESSARETHLTYRDASAINDLVEVTRQTAEKFRYCVKNDLRLDQLRMVSVDKCAFGGEDGRSRSGGLPTLRDSFPGGTFRALPWASRKLRRVVRSSLGFRAPSSIDASELLQDVERYYRGVFGRSLPVIASTDSGSLFSHLRKGASRTQRLQSRPPPSHRPC